MKLYHGSTVIVDKPLVSYGRDNLDFGKGFYTTNMQSICDFKKYYILRIKFILISYENAL